MKLSNLRKAAVMVSIAAALAVSIMAQVKTTAQTDRERLVGTWHLVKIDSPTADGQPQPPTPIGLLIFTTDGYEAVQLMYPKEASPLNNKFVHDGYEASFGTFDVDEKTHILRYHPIASATRDAFVGTDELLRPTFPDSKHLVMRPANAEEHWSVIWERD